MNINSKRIKSERQKRAWSQEQLADASGLGLRTIQRIENGGTASFESVKALAATLEIPLSDFATTEKSSPVLSKGTISEGKLVAFSCAAIVGLGAISFGAQSFADQVMLDVIITLNDQPEEAGSLLTKDGKDTEMRLDEVLRFVVTPNIQKDGRVRPNHQSTRVSERKIRTDWRTETFD